MFYFLKGQEKEPINPEGDVLHEYAEKFTELAKFDSSYDAEFINHLLGHSKHHSRNLDELRESLHMEYCLRKRKIEGKNEVLAEYGTKLKELLPWSAYDQEYIRNILIHAVKHSSDNDDLAQQLETEYRAHLKKSEELIMMEKLQAPIMEAYSDLRRHLHLTSEEALKYMKTLHRRKCSYCVDKPGRLVGKHIRLMVQKKGKKGVDWVKALVIVYSNHRKMHLLLWQSAPSRGFLASFYSKKGARSGNNEPSPGTAGTAITRRHTTGAPPKAKAPPRLPTQDAPMTNYLSQLSELRTTQQAFECSGSGTRQFVNLKSHVFELVDMKAEEKVKEKAKDGKEAEEKAEKTGDKLPRIEYGDDLEGKEDKTGGDAEQGGEEESGGGEGGDTGSTKVKETSKETTDDDAKAFDGLRVYRVVERRGINVRAEFQVKSPIVRVLNFGDIFYATGSTVTDDGKQSCAFDFSAPTVELILTHPLCLLLMYRPGASSPRGWLDELHLTQQSEASCGGAAGGLGAYRGRRGRRVRGGRGGR
jgi:hypothetical protein